MDKLIEILEDIQPDIDYNTCEDLIDGHHLDSLSIISLIAELEDSCCGDHPGKLQFRKGNVEHDSAPARGGLKCRSLPC